MSIRPLLLVVLGLSLAFMVPGECIGRELPTKGTFEGVYHKDRWGRARISFFVIPKDLEPRFAPFDGKRVRFEVTKAHQKSIPGDVFVQEVGKIEALHTGPKFEVGIYRAKGGPVDEWLVSLTNRSDKPVTIWHNYLQLRYWRPTKLRGSLRAYPRAASAKLAWSNRVEQGAPLVTIPAGGRYAFPFTLEIGDRKAELEARYTHWIEEVRCPYKKWVRVDEDMPELAPARLNLRGPTTGTWSRAFARRSPPAEGTYVLSGTLRTETADALFPMFRHEGVACLPMRVRAYDSQGRSVDVKSIAICDNGTSARSRWAYKIPHRLEALPASGFPVRVHFWHRSRFPEHPITRLQLEVLGASGISRVPVAVSFRDSLRSTPPAWGPAAHGVRIRVRALPPRSRDRPPDFIVEAVNDAGTPRMLFTGEGNGGEIALLIDGKPVPLPLGRIVYGWAGKHTCSERDEYTLRLPSSHRIEPGKHTVQVIIKGPGGTWPNANREPILVIDGEVRTAATPFVVR